MINVRVIHKDDQRTQLIRSRRQHDAAVEKPAADESVRGSLMLSVGLVFGSNTGNHYSFAF